MVWNGTIIYIDPVQLASDAVVAHSAGWLYGDTEIESKPPANIYKVAAAVTITV